MLPMDDAEKKELEAQLKYYPIREDPNAPLPIVVEVFVGVAKFGPFRQVAYSSLPDFKNGVMASLSNHGYAPGGNWNKWQKWGRSMGKRLLIEMISRGYLRCMHVVYDNGKMSVEEVDLAAEIGKDFW
jgi:hypothetical protein